ncbi:hypothetical protein [Planococcus donghaensis]|uniref:hypothetical protein n=1 Tax=Planococcus donghaensis TaxID=414778 RepID=UPI003734E4C9
MITANPINDMALMLKNALEEEVVVAGNLILVKKLRELVIRSGTPSFSFKVDCDITFQNIHHQEATINNVEILLLPSELPQFLSALINHANPLPNNYSHRLVMEKDVYCLYMESRELPEQFAVRLAAALKALNF